MIRFCSISVLVFLTSLSVCFPTFADETLTECVKLEEVPSDRLAVAIRLSPPFVQQDPLSGLDGISIKLWEAIAARLDVEFEYVCLSLSQTLDSLSNGTIDIAISPLTISSEREALFDFSHQYFTSSLVIAAAPDRIKFDVLKIVNALTDLLKNEILLYGLALVVGLAILFATIGSVYGQYYNPASGKMGPGKAGLAVHMFIMSILNLLGSPSKEFFRFRVVSLQIIFLFTFVFGIVFSATVGGIITSVFLTSAERTSVIDESDLAKYKVSTLAGSTAEELLIDRFDRENTNAEDQYEWLRRDSWQETLEDVVSRRAELVVGDWAQLTYLTNQPEFNRKVNISAHTIRFEPYGWGLPVGSPLREEVNRVLIEILRSDAWPVTVRRYMGTDLAGQ